MNLFNHDFENSIIGAIIADQTCLFEITHIVTPESFSTVNCRHAFASALELESNSISIDVITLSDHLERFYPDTDWMLWLAQISRNHYKVSNIVDYAKSVREYHDLRSLHRAGQGIIETCNDEDIGLTEKLDIAQQSIFDLQTGDESGPLMSKDLLKEFVDHIEECSKHGGGLTGIPTGYQQFDEACGGLHGGELIILAARPGMGKTNLALNFSSNMINQDKSVLFFSLEMPRKQIMGRMCAARSLLEYNRVLRADFNNDEYGHFTDFVATMANTKFAVDDRAGLTLSEIRGKARKHKMQYGLDMIVIDYLQLIEGTGESETVIISNISKGLKRLAKDLDIPVVALSQLNRNLETRGDKRPVPSDLRQSGSIEQDADIIIFLYRDVVYDKQCAAPHLAEMIIAKLRHGECQTITLDTQFNKCRFLPTSEIASGFVEETRSKSFADRRG